MNKIRILNILIATLMGIILVLFDLLSDSVLLIITFLLMIGSIFPVCLFCRSKLSISFLYLIFFKIALDISYVYLITPVFSYEGYEFNINIVKLIESYILFLVISILIPKSEESLSNIVVGLLILVSYFPLLTIYAFKNESRTFVYAVTSFWIFVITLFRSFKIQLRSGIKSIKTYYIIFFCLSAIVFLLSYKYLGLTLKTDFTQIYDIRYNYIKKNIPLAGYLFNWQAYIVNPIFLSIFINRRKWIYVFLIILFQIYLFSVTGIRAFLLSIFYVPMLIFAVSRGKFLFLLSTLFILIIIIGILSHYYFDNVILTSLLIRRYFFVPSLLYFYYYDFFSNNGPLFLSSTRLFRNFIHYPYDLDPPHLIGGEYFNRPEMGANTGLVGDAYMNFGFIGFVFWGILLVVILKLIDAFSEKKDIRVTAAAISLPVMSLTNSALFTNLLTHGLFLCLVLLYLLPEKLLTDINRK